MVRNPCLSRYPRASVCLRLSMGSRALRQVRAGLDLRIARDARPRGGLLCAAGQWVSVCAMRLRPSPHSRERGVRPDHGRCSLVTRVALILTLTRCTNQQLEPMLFQLSGESHHRGSVRSTHDHPSAGRRLHCALFRCIRLNPAQSGGVKAIRSPTNTVPYEPDNPSSQFVP